MLFMHTRTSGTYYEFSILLGKRVRGWIQHKFNFPKFCVFEVLFIFVCLLFIKTLTYLQLVKKIYDNIVIKLSKV